VRAFIVGPKRNPLNLADRRIFGIEMLARFERNQNAAEKGMGTTGKKLESGNQNW
jgi:hypothetical protein